MAQVNKFGRNFFFSSTMEARIALGISISEMINSVYRGYTLTAYQCVSNQIYKKSISGGIDNINDLANILLSQGRQGDFPETSNQRNQRISMVHGWDKNRCVTAHYLFLKNWDGYGLTEDNAELFSGGQSKKRAANAKGFVVGIGPNTAFPKSKTIELCPGMIKFKSSLFIALHEGLEDLWGQENETYHSIVKQYIQDKGAIFGPLYPGGQNMAKIIKENLFEKPGILNKAVEAIKYSSMVTNSPCILYSKCMVVIYKLYERHDKKSPVLQQINNITNEAMEKAGIKKIPKAANPLIKSLAILYKEEDVIHDLLILSKPAAEYGHEVLHAECCSTVMSSIRKDSEVNLKIGNMTACCQKIGGAGQDVCIDGWGDPHSINYVFSMDGKIIAHAWTWVGTKGELVLDSIEGTKEANVYNIAKCIIEASQQWGGDVIISSVDYGVTNKVAKAIKKMGRGKGTRRHVSPLFNYRYMDYEEGSGTRIIK